MIQSSAIREYRSSDFETLWEIDQACFEQGISYTRGELAFYIGRKRGFTLLAEAKDKIVGFIVVDRDRHNQGHVITIDVLPQARRAGLGSRLLSTAEERLRTVGAAVVFLETAVGNSGALEFYKRHGYTIIDTIPQYYLGSIDALVLAKNLANTES
jgi:ribosomal-protein-alanine N-acetyltransferase